MPIRTGAEYLESLRDDRHVAIDGERVMDVTSDPRFAGAAHTLAELLDLQHDPDLTDTMTFTSPATGDKVGITHIIPQSQQDVLDRNKAIQVWMDCSCGMLGRSPDYKNMFISSYAAGADNFKRDGFDGSDNIRNYHNYVRENDQVITHVLVNPQVDRSRPAHLETSDIVAHITKETDAEVSHQRRPDGGDALRHGQRTLGHAGGVALAHRHQDRHLGLFLRLCHPPQHAGSAVHLPPPSGANGGGVPRRLSSGRQI